MRRNLVAVALVLAQGVLFAATSQVPGLGAEAWHHVATLVGSLALAAALWRPVTRSRRFLAVGVLAFTVLATVSGFWLLYWKEGIRASGYQDWGVFWHVAWSWLAAIFFFQHTWINRVSLAHFVRRSFSSVNAATVHIGAYVVVIVAFIVTWSDVGKDWFHVENYVPLTLYAWLLATVPSYAAWGLMARTAARRSKAGAERLRRFQTLWRSRVDLALVPLAALVVVSGIPLTFLDPWTEANGWKYVAKYWHVWPSVAFSVLVFAHGVQLWGPVQAHWRKYSLKDRRASRGKTTAP